MKFVAFALTLSMSILSFSQAVKDDKITWKTWSEPSVFSISSVSVKDYGPLSDTLSLLYNVENVLLADSAYVLITNSADYYYWFTKKHPELFKSPIETYEFYYFLGDNLNMCRFISTNYLLDELPLKFRKVSNHTNVRNYNAFNEARLKSNPFHLYREFIDFKVNEPNYLVTNDKPVPNIPKLYPPKIDSGAPEAQ